MITTIDGEITVPLLLLLLLLLRPPRRGNNSLLTLRINVEWKFTKLWHSFANGRSLKEVEEEDEDESQILADTRLLLLFGCLDVWSGNDDVNEAAERERKNSKL